MLDSIPCVENMMVPEKQGISQQTFNTGPMVGKCGAVKMFGWYVKWFNIWNYVYVGGSGGLETAGSAFTPKPHQRLTWRACAS